MLTVDSQTPITVTQNGVAKTYSKWGAPEVFITAQQGKFRLQIIFNLYTVDGEAYPAASKTFVCEDVLTDGTLGPLAGSFFTGVVTKAFQQGILT